MYHVKLNLSAYYGYKGVSKQKITLSQVKKYTACEKYGHQEIKILKYRERKIVETLYSIWENL